MQQLHVNIAITSSSYFRVFWLTLYLIFFQFWGILAHFYSVLSSLLFLVYFYFSLSSVSCNLHLFLSSVSCNLHFSLSSVSCNLVEILKKNSFVMKTDPISSAPFSPKYFLSFNQILIFEQCVEPKPVWRGGGIGE